MKHSIKDLNNCSFEITLFFTNEEYNNSKKTIKTKEHSRVIWNLVIIGLKEILNENKIDFIGEPYDLSSNLKKGEITFKFDVYPEVKFINSDWEIVRISGIDVSNNHTIKDEDLQVLIENYLVEVMKSVEVSVPQRLVLTEVNNRIESIKEYYGLDNYKDFINKKDVNERKAFDISVKKASEKSLKKHFLLEEVFNQFKIHNKSERDLYEKLKR